MKKAKVIVVQVEVVCPCGGNVSHESGSHYFPVHDVPETGVCDDCGEEIVIPRPKTLKGFK